jgi:hypothetical protein
LAAAGWRRPADPLAVTLLWGLLILDMLLASPVCHLHYFALAIPLAAGLIAARAERADTPGAGLLTLFAFGLIANLLPVLPEMYRLRDGGVATAGALALWAAGMAVLWRRVRRPVPQAGSAVPRAAA